MLSAKDESLLSEKGGWMSSVKDESLSAVKDEWSDVLSEVV